jgi:polyisoprenyl-teichoic acid--peptidoglycan teichoic acid transferase
MANTPERVTEPVARRRPSPLAAHGGQPGHTAPGSPRPPTIRQAHTARDRPVHHDEWLPAELVAVRPVPRTITPSMPSPPTKPARRRRTPVWAIVLIVVGSLLSVASGGLAFAVQTIVNRVGASIHQQDLLGDTVARDASGGVSINGVINLLLVGIDTRAKNPTMGSRADSIIIVHIPATHDRAYLISIPRDTDVQVPAFAKTHFAGGEARINAAFQFGSTNGGGAAGGFQLLSKTIRSLYGISFNGGAIVNFGGFTDIVQKLGGVDMYVDERTTSLHDGFRTGTHTPAKPFITHSSGAHWIPVRGVTPVIYKKGYQHLTPTEALDFVRIRDFLPNGDYDRERHQQQFIQAVMEQAYHKGLANPLDAGTFLSSISKAFVFSGGGIPISTWIFTLKSITPDSLMMLKTNNGTYNTLHVPRAGGGFDSREVLSQTSLDMMNAVAADNLDSFVEAHPSWVS